MPKESRADTLDLNGAGEPELTALARVIQQHRMDHPDMPLIERIKALEVAIHEELAAREFNRPGRGILAQAGWSGLAIPADRCSCLAPSDIANRCRKCGKRTK